MSASRQVGAVATGIGSNGAKRPRGPRIAPVTRAVRVALAASAAALALAGSGVAMAGVCTVPVGNVVYCNGDFLDTINYAVEDLTLVVGNESPSTVTPPDFNTGIYAGWAGTIGVINYADITTYGADGIYAYGNEDITIANSGSLHAYGPGSLTGVLAYSTGGNIAISNDGGIDVYSYDSDAHGIVAYSYGGDVAIHNEGSIEVYSIGSESSGINALGANVEVTNSAAISARSDGTAMGITARGDDLTTVVNDGDIYATSNYSTAFGIYAEAGNGVNVSSSGNISAAGYYAAGIFARSGGDTQVDNSGAIYVMGYYYAAGIFVYGDGPATVANSGYIATGSSGDARGIHALSFDSSILVENSGVAVAISAYTDAIGIYGYSHSGDVAIHNDGDIAAVAYYGLGDGIFASGTNVEVTSGTEGSIVAVGYNWAAGIEAQGSDMVSVSNAGDIYARTYDVSEAFGIYAAGGAGGASVDNSGSIYVHGYDSSVGISVEASGPIAITNSGYVAAGYFDGSYASGYATGILALSGTDGNAISIDNSGYAFAISFAGSSALEARSLGVDGTAGITNSGDVVAVALSIYGAGATGIAASAQGDAWIDNSGDVYAYSAGAAYGAVATSFNGDASVVNSGNVESVNTAFPYYSAYGIVAGSANGLASVDNSGTIDVYSPYIGVGMEVDGTAGTTATNSGDIDANAWVSYGIRASSGLGDVSIDNSGTIAAHYTGTYVANAAIGIFASTTSGDIAVDNSGSVEAASYSSLAAPVFATSSDGDIAIDNSGVLKGHSYGGDVRGAYAIATLGTAAITNSGDISSVSVYGDAYGVMGRGANVEATNSGDIVAEGYYSASGVYLQASTGDASLDNSGNIEASALGYAVGAFAYSGGQVFVDNSGDVAANATYSVAVGMFASGYQGVTVDNSGSTSATSVGNYAFGVVARGDDVQVTNSGDIAATGVDRAMGVDALGNEVSLDSSGSIEASGLGDVIGASASAYGQVLVGNSGSILANATNGDAYGVYTGSYTGDAIVDNSGSIAATSTYGEATGVSADSYYESAQVTNAGDITATGLASARGVYLQAESDVSLASSGSIEANADAFAFGALLSSGLGDTSIDNSGTIAVNADGFALGVVALGDSVIAGNSGSIVSTASNGAAISLIAQGDSVQVTNAGDLVAEGYYQANAIALTAYGDGSLDSSGNVRATSSGTAYAVVAYSYTGALDISNSGDIAASATDGTASGVVARSDSATTVTNSGTISAEGGGAAVGVMAQSYGDVLVQNSGTISATHDSAAIAVQLDAIYGTATLENSGTIETHTSVAGSVVVVGSAGVNEIRNTGTINGAIVTFGGDDVFANGAGGTWLIEGDATDFGDGDDSFDNEAGSTLHFAGGSIDLGAGNNAFSNAGTILVSGSGAIDVGAGSTVLMAALDPPGLVNDGTISFFDGVPDDMLTINGDLAGTGEINLDVSFLNGTSDLLYVDGDVVDGTSQTVNLAIDSFDGVISGASVPVVEATGSVAANAFTGGQVLNFDPGNFVDLQVLVSNDGAGVVNASVGIAGLNDTGVLAGSVANGAHSLINSSIGTRNQRLGLAPVLAEGDVGLGPWIRVFSDQGDVAPTTSGFGSDRNFDFSQENSGTEFGMNFSLGNGVSFGVMGGNAEGTQKLGSAQGSDEIDLHTSGLYASWAGARFYADASWRWMSFDSVLMSAAGEQRTSGNATAFNFEAGYTGWTLGGVNFVPQAQYTRSVIDNIDMIEGSQVDMVLYGGVSERARVGISLNRSFAGSFDTTWTPYGSLSAVREMDGNTGYTLADRFSGRTSTTGSGALAELGLGVQKGRLAATAGIHLADGDAVQGFYGGQLVLRYTW